MRALSKDVGTRAYRDWRTRDGFRKRVASNDTRILVRKKSRSSAAPADQTKEAAAEKKK
jgi:hypothetical protein